MSPSIPKREASLPPSPGREKCTSRFLSLEGTSNSMTIDKFYIHMIILEKGSDNIKSYPCTFIYACTKD